MFQNAFFVYFEHINYKPKIAWIILVFLPLSLSLGINFLLMQVILMGEGGNDVCHL
jgi:hypothetical protein